MCVHLEFEKYVLLRNIFELSACDMLERIIYVHLEYSSFCSISCERCWIGSSTYIWNHDENLSLVRDVGAISVRDVGADHLRTSGIMMKNYVRTSGILMKFIP